MLVDAIAYTVARAELGDQPIVVLTAPGRRLRVALRGAALLGYEVTHGGVVHDVADGHRDADEIATRPGSRFAIMVPFAGRIADARYRFQGWEQDLQPGIAGADRASRHGFVRDADFHVASLQADEHSATVRLETSIHPQPGYPHAIDLAVEFVIDAAGLTLQATMRNVGDNAAPCFFGWHAYFRVGEGKVDSWQLQIPAQTLIRTGSDMIALAGEAAYVPLDDAPALDFREPRLIGDSILDQGYTDLEADADGRIRTHLRNPASGLAIAVWQERGVMHAFTSDTLSRDVRRAIALEPMECMADAFNRPECAEAIRLDAGAERSFRCGVEISA